MPYRLATSQCRPHPNVGPCPDRRKRSAVPPEAWSAKEKGRPAHPILPARKARPFQVSLGWVKGFEPSTSRATIWRANQLRHTHRILLRSPNGSLARQEGLEPPAYCLEGSCSIHLSYWRICLLAGNPRRGAGDGAGDGNRTHATSLEGWDSAIELHPQRIVRESTRALPASLSSKMIAYPYQSVKCFFRLLCPI